MSCCKKGKILPKRKTMLRSITLSVANAIAGAIRSGKIKADPGVVSHRIATCKNCRHLDKNRCTVCGCFISLKAGIKTEKCPLNLW